MKFYGLYKNLPVWLQNVACLIKGYEIEKQRYGGLYENIFAQTITSDFYSTADILRYKEEHIARIIEHAYKHSPYYRAKYSGAGLTPRDFCYVALPYAHKNHHNLLKSIEILESQQVSFTTALTIPKEDSLGLYTLIKELSTQLRYVKLTNLGMLSRQEVFSLYAMSRFLIFPSLLETLGLPLIEAAHCGTKVLASNHTLLIRA